ncbi:MAG: protein kinase [Elusimicrobiota bacterium]|jgi:tetratricopeptide (TPR) repeat protein
MHILAVVAAAWLSALPAKAADNGRPWDAPAADPQAFPGQMVQLAQVEQKSRELPTAPASQELAGLLRGAADKILLKDYAGAIADSDRALALAPGQAAAYYYRAAANNLNGRYEAAAQNATQALSIDPNDAAARDARAFAYNRLGRFQDALADSNHSLEANPHNPYAYANRGFTYERLGDPSAMIRDLGKAAAIDPRLEPIYSDAAAAYGAPASQSATAGTDPAPARLPLRQRHFLIILLSSLVGGLLVALGLLQVFGPQWARRMEERRDPAPAIRAAIARDYIVGRPLGQGGMGVVYEAVDRNLGRKVAIKMLQEAFQGNPQAKEQFLNEARTVATLRHPNIVSIHSIVSDDKGLCLVFEFISGQTLYDIGLSRGKFSLAEAKSIIAPVCAALDFAHGHNVVHRDLKPGNIMITPEGQVKVMDFGISRRVRAKTLGGLIGRGGYAVTNSVLGTPYYMAPEQEDGMVRPESDIYSLGTCLYEMLTGRRPYADPVSHAKKLACNYERPSDLEPFLPRAVDALLAAALDPDPDYRIHTAAEFQARLELIRDDGTNISNPS